MDSELIEGRLGTQVLGHPLRYLASVESTQEVVRAAAQAGAGEGLAVVAGQQTAGKGRAGRAWWSPPTGGLYLSLLLRPSLPADNLAWVTMVVALGMAEAIEAETGLRPDLKWPNDLEWQGRKLAGVLAEGTFTGDHLDYVVAGLGLNVAVDFRQQPGLAGSAVSLHEAARQPLDVTDLLVAALQHIEPHYLALQRGQSPQPAWAVRLVTVGQAVEVRTADGQSLFGTASGVLPDGALRVRLESGAEQIVRALDVTLRPSLPPRTNVWLQEAEEMPSQRTTR